MTSKEIALAVNKTERAVQGWAKKTGEKISSVSEKISSAGHGKGADYDLAETCQIIETGLGKNAADLFRASASKQPQSAADSRLDRLEAVAEKLLVAVGNLVSIQGPSLAVTKLPALPAPQLATRDELRRIVQEAANDSGDYAGTWRQLYQEIYYRLHVNVRERAKNQGVQALDIVEAEGLLPEAVAIAREIFGRAA